MNNLGNANVPRLYPTVTRLGSAWHVAHATIIAPYKAFSREKLPARIGTHIGLMHVNVTLTGEFANPIPSHPIQSDPIQSNRIRQQVGTSAMGEWVVIFDYIGITDAILVRL